MAKPKRWRTRYENELALKLWESGFVVCRCPASGGGKKRYPCLDLFAWCPKSGKLYAVEVKSSSECDSEECLERMITQAEVEKARELEKRGVIVLLALRNRGRWIWFELSDGRIKRGSELLLDNCMTLTEWSGRGP